MKWTNCVFDLYGTLVDIHTDESAPCLWENLLEHYRTQGAVYSTPQELKERYFAIVREREQGSVRLRNDSHESHPEIQIEYVFQQLFQERGVHADMAQAVEAGRRFREWSMDYIRLYDGAKKLLTDLKIQGCKVYLLSNAQAIFTTYELEVLDLISAFDGIYLSSDYGCKKPDRRFFRILLEEQGIDPITAVMIGNDGVCDIAGARAVGMSTVYIHSNISPKEASPVADYVLPEMDLSRVGEILMGK